MEPQRQGQGDSQCVYTNFTAELDREPHTHAIPRTSLPRWKRFRHREDAVAADAFEDLPPAARPADLDAVGCGRRAEAEVEAEIVVRVIAGLAEHGAGLLQAAGGDDRRRA